MIIKNFWQQLFIFFNSKQRTIVPQKLIYLKSTKKPPNTSGGKKMSLFKQF